MRADDEKLPLPSMIHSVAVGYFVVSILTTTGYGFVLTSISGMRLAGILLLIMFVGGCAGSTGGGLK